MISIFRGSLQSVVNITQFYRKTLCKVEKKEMKVALLFCKMLVTIKRETKVM